VRTVDDSGVGTDPADESSHDHAPATSRRRARPAASGRPRGAARGRTAPSDTAAGQRTQSAALLRAFERAISSDAHTNRALRLLAPVLAALTVTILGAAIIVVSAGAGWSFATGLGLVGAGGIGAIVATRRRRRSAPIQLPKPRAAP